MRSGPKNRNCPGCMKYIFVIVYGMLGVLDVVLLSYFSAMLGDLGPASAKQESGYIIQILASSLSAVSSLLVIYHLHKRSSSGLLFILVEALLFGLMLLSMAGSVCFADTPTPNSLTVHFRKSFAVSQQPPRFLDKLQAEVGCCGVRSYKDYKVNGTLRLPQSCCTHLTQPCDMTYPPNIHPRGCIPRGFQRMLSGLRKDRRLSRLKFKSLLVIPHLLFLISALQIVTFTYGFFFISRPLPDPEPDDPDILGQVQRSQFINIKYSAYGVEEEDLEYQYTNYGDFELMNY